MNERMDHTRVALDNLGAADKAKLGTTEEIAWALSAQVHATLALVEQQRIANLIAVFQLEGGPHKIANNWIVEVRDANGRYEADEDANVHIISDIREGLGLW